MDKALPMMPEQAPIAELDEKTIRAVMVEGDLSSLGPGQLAFYYRKVCDRLGLKWETKPFALIRLNNKLTLYALKDCTDQLRAMHGVSITSLEGQMLDKGMYQVVAKGQDRHGKTDCASGIVSVGILKGDALANALMKAETKAKRRLTLSLCGLGWLDESERETVPGAVEIDPNTMLPTDPSKTRAQQERETLSRFDFKTGENTGEPLPEAAMQDAGPLPSPVPPTAPPPPSPEAQPPSGYMTQPRRKALWARAREMGWDEHALRALMSMHCGVEHTDELTAEHFRVLMGTDQMPGLLEANDPAAYRPKTGANETGTTE